MKHRKLASFLAATAVAASMAGAATLTTASADPKISTLIANPTTVTVDLANSAGVPVTVALDSGCSAAFKQGQQYSITATVGLPVVATVAPSVSGALNCNGDPTKGAVNSATFTIKAKCVTAPTKTTVNFTPVAGPPGIQNKLAGTSIEVNVTNAAATTCDGGGVIEEGGDNPAAPAVANAYLNANPDAAKACKDHFGTKSWRGSAISGVAAIMPTPESIKDTMDADAWVNQVVTTMLDPVCGITPPPAV